MTKTATENTPRWKLGLTWWLFLSLDKFYIPAYRYLFISFIPCLTIWQKKWVFPVRILEGLEWQKRIIDKSWLPQKTTAKNSLKFIPMTTLETKSMAMCCSMSIAIIYRCINWLNYEKFMISNCSSLVYRNLLLFPSSLAELTVHVHSLPVYYLSLIFHNLTIIQIC